MRLFWFGIAMGVLIAIPMIAAASRRTENRMRRLMQRARTAERLAGLGTLTGGLAHEIKNPLSTIGLNIQLLQEDLHQLSNDLPNDSPEHQQAQRIVRRFEGLARETGRLRDILEDFLRFAGRLKLDLIQTDLNALVDELADFFTPQAEAAGCQVRTQLGANPPTAPADATLLKQALLNLLINATQAMLDARAGSAAHGGADELLIRTERPRTLDAPQIRIHVIDTGAGIEPEQIEKILQPYYSTKKGGTGLGLPTTKRIVEEHGGTLTVHSEPGRGTDFVITLPVTAPQSKQGSRP